jgi:hypothetical protein
MAYLLLLFVPRRGVASNSRSKGSGKGSFLICAEKADAGGVPVYGFAPGIHAFAEIRSGF